MKKEMTKEELLKETLNTTAFLVARIKHLKAEQPSLGYEVGELGEIVSKQLRGLGYDMESKRIERNYLERVCGVFEQEGSGLAAIRVPLT